MILSNTTCPHDFVSKNGKCYGQAYGGIEHDFSGYTNTQKAQWACNAGEGVTWNAVLPDKPRGQTWWIGDENGGYCTNNKVDIIKYAKCGKYGHNLHSDKDPKRWVCAPSTVDANPFEFAPGDKNALYAQVMQNQRLSVKLGGWNGTPCKQYNFNSGGSWDTGAGRGSCEADSDGVRCTMPVWTCGDGKLYKDWLPVPPRKISNDDIAKEGPNGWPLSISPVQY